MKVTRKRPRVLFVPVYIELETEEELENLITILEPTRSISLKDWCIDHDLDIDKIDTWNFELFKELTKNRFKEDC